MSLDAADITTAIALVLIIEGMLPFLSPTVWRDTIERLVRMSDGQIRFLVSRLCSLV